MSVIVGANEDKRKRKMAVQLLFVNLSFEGTIGENYLKTKPAAYPRSEINTT